MRHRWVRSNPSWAVPAIFRCSRCGLRKSYRPGGRLSGLKRFIRPQGTKLWLEERLLPACPSASFADVERAMRKAFYPCGTFAAEVDRGSTMRARLGRVL